MKRRNRLVAVAMLFALLFILPITAQAQELRAGGTPFGVRLFTDGVAVVGLREAENQPSPAEAAGIRIGDVILTVDGNEIKSVADLTRIVDASGGKELTVTVRRQNETLRFCIRPEQRDGGYRLGVYIRDSMAGIGTLTYIDPKTGAFGGLGHGIGDPQTGTPVKMTRGAVLDVKLREVVRGRAGAPGELRGSLGSNKCGTLLQNNECGVFGILQNKDAGKLYPVGKKEELHTGNATILTTL